MCGVIYLMWFMYKNRRLNGIIKIEMIEELMNNWYSLPFFFENCKLTIYENNLFAIV